jgi:hypothetical protein
MNAHVKRNLAVDTAYDSVQPYGLATEPKRDPRAELAAQFIPAGSRVLDLSAASALERLLPYGCSYQSRDSVTCDGGNVCNIAGGDYPTQAAAKSDVIVMLGVLEQIVDVENLFTHLRFSKQDVVLSYCATDLGGDRAGAANNLSFYDLARLFDRYGFRIECTTPVSPSEMLMRLTPTDRLKPVTSCSVAVISCGDDDTFGDRLGTQMINALLPGEAEVHHLNFRTLNEACEQYDLVVLGTGNSLFQPLLTGEVLDIIGRGKASIGIFGTQYRELIPRAAMTRVIEQLDTWYARSEDDVLMYGRGRKNVVHLGDWLIDQFPLTQSSENEPLQIGPETGVELPLDRIVKIIQSHRQVHSARLAPLLCALTSAELASYEEAASPQQADIVSGRFRSMLIDIFGRSYPEKEFFLVDREAVRRYKARVHRNVAQVGEQIDNLLRNVAVVSA